MTAIIPFILANWKAVLGGLVLTGLTIALAITRADAKHWHKQSDLNASLYQTEVAKNAVNVASIDMLTAKVGEQNTAIDKLAADSDARMKAGVDALAIAKQGRTSTESAVAALQASAGRNIAPDAPCVSSAAFKAIGKDL